MHGANAKKQWMLRAFFYATGMVVLALGLMLNSKSGLGVSPIMSVAYFAAHLSGWRFADTTLVWYTLLVLGELLLHSLRHKPKLVFLQDILQLPLSIVFTRVMNVFAVYIPDFATDCQGSFWGSLGGRLIVLGIAMVCTGIGAAMTMSMRVVVNPGDGIVQNLADFIGKPTGLTKNGVDLCCFACTSLLSLLLCGQLVGIGLGTVIAVIVVGRVIALFNATARDAMVRAAGV